MRRLTNSGLFGALVAIVICATTSAIVVAQDTVSPSLPAPMVPPAAPATAPISQPSQPHAQPGLEPPAPQKLSEAELDPLIAPIALYPDRLLSQVLRASTYPLEVVEAADWAQQPDNKSLTGNALTQALKSQNWDPSVVALVPFPRVLAMMSDRVKWTEQLGNAFLAQQADVMAAVQQFRQEVLVAGKLKVPPQVTDAPRPAPKHATYRAYRHAYRYAYRYSPYSYSPYSYYGPAPHSDGN